MPNSFTIYRGDTTTLNIAVKDAAGAPYDLSGCTLFLCSKRTMADTACVFQTDSTPAGSITISEPPSAGLAVARILPAHTLGLPNVPAKLLWGIQLRSGQNTTTIAAGVFMVTPVVAHAGAA